MATAFTIKAVVDSRIIAVCGCIESGHSPEPSISATSGAQAAHWSASFELCDRKRKRDAASWNSDPVNRPGLPRNYRHPCSVRPCGGDYRCGGDAQQQRAGAAFKIRDGLLLVPVRSVRHHERAVVHLVGGGLSPVRSRGAFIRCCEFWADGCKVTLAPMAEVASHRHGYVLYLDADCVLRGQRSELAAVKGTAGSCVLGPAGCGRGATDPLFPLSSSCGVGL